MITVYVVCKMTGLYCDDMIRDAKRISRTLKKKGIKVLHPVLREKIPNKHVKLSEPSLRAMKANWDGDKQDIKEAHAILDTSPERFSAGGKEEVGKARYRDWKPVIALYPKDHFIPYIVKQERDSCVYSVKQAGEVISNIWGTREKRMWWKFKLYVQHPFDISIRKIVQFFN